MVDNTLGSKGINTRYSYSNVTENLTSVFVSGGEALDDVNFFRQEAFKANPDYRFCSADTIGRDLRGRAVENTEFMTLTALIRNFYVWLVGKIAANIAFGLEATSRVKKFVFRFVQVPFRWVFRSRQWHLQLFTSRPYDRLRL